MSKMALLFSVFSSLLINNAFAIPSSAYAAPSSFSWPATKNLLTFGDSYTYVQGTNGRQNYSFIGDVQHYRYNASTILSDHIVQNQTSTAEGGPNWVEFLTGCGLKPGLTDPKTCERRLWDFAFAGADVSVEFTPRHHHYTVMFVEQVRQFVKYGWPVLGKEGLVTPRETLVGVWIGINDINDSDQYNVSFPAFYDSVIGTLFASLETLYDLGYRDYLLMNLPPLNRTPGNLIRCAGPLPNATMIEWWNSSLQKHAAAMQTHHPDSNVMLFDANTFLNRVLDHHEEYGIKNSTGYCAAYDQPYINTDPGMYGCLPLEEYFWFNTGHLTSHTHSLLAHEVEKFLLDQSRH